MTSSCHSYTTVLHTLDGFHAGRVLLCTASLFGGSYLVHGRPAEAGTHDHSTQMVHASNIGAFCDCTWYVPHVSKLIIRLGQSIGLSTAQLPQVEPVATGAASIDLHIPYGE